MTVEKSLHRKGTASDAAKIYAGVEKLGFSDGQRKFPESFLIKSGLNTAP